MSNTPVFPYTEKEEKLARYAKALSHPVRVYILQFLDSQQGCYVGNIVEELPMAQSSVSQHLKELKDAGLIQGTVTPPRVKYCIDRQNWEEARVMFAFFFGNIREEESCCD
ncbi:MAG: winged helix-turn-helix transcriptional regulator [Saprospirales bacterium]|nr:winged helix-turn-helix transcriptional regulator [Saprospirales bacterium]MBK8489689.1 winged helix-turn-helix transcriptional regulator [Saprospirales bacterium]